MSLAAHQHPAIALPLERLLAIRLWARASGSIPRHPSRQCKPGRSPGLDFRELRAYQAGDEIRHIDWRVTARLGRPHTRLYGEAQDQQHWLLLDLSPAMYFGSGPQLKARLGCELAAALLWQGEKQANTLVCHGLEFRIQSQRGPLVPLLQTLCQQYDKGLARTPLPHTLAQRLARLKLPHGARLTLIGDHRPADPALCQQLQLLGRRHDLHYWQIRDPLEAVLPPQGQLAVRFGTQHGWLDASHAGFSRRYQLAADRQAQLSQQQLLPLVQRLYRLDNGQPLQQQWQEGKCH